LLSILDLELATQLRSILHHPEFQALEAAWRGLDLLVRKFGGEENLKLFVLDVSKEELAADLKAQDHLEESGICKLIQRQVDDQPWAVWLGLFAFGDTLADVEALGRLAKVSAQAGAPFLASARAALVGCDSFATHPDPVDWKQPLPAEVHEAWQTLRELPETAYLGLALPRFLLRQPYGKDSDPIEAFPFEELPADPPHESYLWGNPAVVCGYFLAQAFQAEGWAMHAAGYGELGELPVHKFKREGEMTTKSCAEAWLSERVAEALRRKGLMPLLSIKGRDAVRVAGMQSLRSPTSPLAGRWKA
jgi:type VI secretion system ImpC/EvpB family protein